jgi:hypothetical protein
MLPGCAWYFSTQHIFSAHKHAEVHKQKPRETWSRMSVFAYCRYQEKQRIEAASKPGGQVQLLVEGTSQAPIMQTQVRIQSSMCKYTRFMLKQLNRTKKTQIHAHTFFVEKLTAFYW